MSNFATLLVSGAVPYPLPVHNGVLEAGLLLFGHNGHEGVSGGAT